MAIMVSIAPPPKPPSASEKLMPSQPSSANLAQFSASQPFSLAAILRRVSNAYCSRTKRSTPSLICFCSSEYDRSILSSLQPGVARCLQPQHHLGNHVLLDLVRAA